MLEALRASNIETHLVMSKSAELTLSYESDLRADDVKALADHWYPVKDVGAAVSSGSFPTAGMVIAPVLCANHVGNRDWRYLIAPYPSGRRRPKGAQETRVDGT
jgi:hypothetical protein